MHLFIRTLTGKRIVLDVDATATIRVINRIKEKVRETTFRPSRISRMISRAGDALLALLRAQLCTDEVLLCCFFNPFPN